MKSILCYGDSNTFGAKAVEFDLLEEAVVFADLRYAEDVRWTGVLQKELGSEYRVIEEGLCARTTTLDDPIEGTYKNGKDGIVLNRGTQPPPFERRPPAFRSIRRHGGSRPPRRRTHLGRPPRDHGPRSGL